MANPKKLVPPVPPPPASKTGKSTGAAFNAFINAHPIMRPYADIIWKWADKSGVDKVVAATLLWHEGFAEATRRGVDPNTITSPTGEGVGPAQINPKVWLGKTTPWGQVIKQKDLIDPEFNIRFGLTYFASLPGTIDQKYSRYSGGANYTLSTGLPKGYVPKSGLTPTEQGSAAAQQKAANAAGQAVLFDKWAVLGKDGRVKFVPISDSSSPPANVLKYGPTPLTQTQFQSVWKQNYSDTFFSYSGRQASGKEIASILKNAPSLYTLSQTLAKTPAFLTSPTYKAHGPGIVAVAKQVYGQNWKVDRKLVATAISQNWDQATLEQNFRNRPEYLEGPQFKDDVAKMGNVYQSIYGSSTDPQTQTTITAVAKDGWTPDQFAAWLRTQPEYKSSQEYKTRALSFAQQLGLITGTVPTLTAEQATLGTAPAAPGAPVQAPPTPPPGAGARVKPKPKAKPKPSAYVYGGASTAVGSVLQNQGRG